MRNDCILQVEDDENDVFLLRHVFERTGIPCPLQVVADAEGAFQYLAGDGVCADRKKCPLPCLVLLDLKLRGRDGFEVLKWIRGHPALKKLVVVVFSSSGLKEDINLAYELGANSYIVKPTQMPELMEIGQLLKGWWLGYNRFAPIDQELRSQEAEEDRKADTGVEPSW